MMTYNYYLSVTTEPAIRFRIAAQTQSGLYNVYAVMEERAPDQAGEDAELCHANEVFVFKNLRSLRQAEQCVRVAGSAAPDWDEFLQFISINRSRGAYHTAICSTGGVHARATMLLQASVRDVPLEEFGMIACAKKDIQLIKYVQTENCASVWLVLHGNVEPQLAASFPLAEKSLALQRMREFRARANRQTLDPTIDFVDSEPVPVHERGDMSEAARVNARNMLLELNRYEGVPPADVSLDESESECDGGAPPDVCEDFTTKPPLVYEK